MRERSDDQATESSDAAPATVTASSDYAQFQLARALAQSDSHLDPEVRQRSLRKAEKWQQVFSGMVSGALAIGSHTPVENTPAWATLEVAAGGFATGALLAGGELRPHETALIDRHALHPAVAARTGTHTERSVLNAYFCSDAGFAELRELLHSGRYRVEVPEEGALLVVAWLIENGHREPARELLSAIAPFFARLRFYPQPQPQPFAPTSEVHVETVAETLQRLHAMAERREVRLQREAHLIWNPFSDRLVTLFAETVTGELPHLKLDSHGRPLRNANGSWTISGGFPCQFYPDGWQDRARAALADFTRLRAQNHSSGKPERKKENLARLRSYLSRCVEDRRSLSGRDVGMIRLILAHIIAARGLPDSPRSRALRTEQARQATLPTKKELSVALIARLEKRPPNGGIDAIEPLAEPINTEEAKRFSLPIGHALPPALKKRLLRCLNAPVKFLVDEGVISSSEVLARVIPQLTAQVGAAGIEDVALRRLYSALYEAFRRRRSLLLLNLERQVRLNDLPWVAALSAFRREDADQRARAHAALTELVTLAITAFPHAILPNKLLSEIRALGDRAGLKLPIVDEIAADIFMGEFTEKYLDAAKRAAKLLRGTLYEVYYRISYEQVLGIDDVAPRFKGAAPVSRSFARLCSTLAGQRADTTRQSVAANGCVIEQEQILTTHNLAVLYEALQLGESLAPRFLDLSRHCFTWICQQQQQRYKDWRPRLHMIKNTAYAFRQMVFFLSLMPKTAIEEFIGWAIAHLAEQRPDFAARFQPALTGLLRAACNEFPESPPASRCFLGWSIDKHWLNSGP